MRKVKKYLAFLMVVFLLCSGSALAVNAEYTFGNYKYSIYDDGALIISYSGAEESISVPATVPNPENGGDVKVYAIGDEAFLGNQLIKSVTLPDSVTVIGQEAFSGCRNLAVADIGDGVKKIGISAFNFCISLKTVHVPNTVTELLNGAFQYCNGIESVTMGSGIKAISDGAFRGCANLEQVTLGINVESVGKLAFGSCAALDTVNIYDKVTSIASDAFDSTFTGIIYGYPDSYAKTFATGKSFDFQAYTYNALEITHSPTKLTYLIGDELDKTGLSVSAIYTDAPKREVTSKCIVSSEPFSSIGSKTVSVSYSESGYSKETSFDVEVAANTVNKITILAQPTRTQYFVGFAGIIDLSGIRLKLEYADGTIEESSDISKMQIVNTFHTSAPGVRRVTLVYDGTAATELTLTVIEDTVQSIRIVSAPSKTVYSYKYSGKIDLSGAKVIATYLSGSEKQVTDSSEMSVSGFNNKQIGEQTLTLSCEGKTAEIKVTVKYEWWQWLIRILLFGWIWY